MVELKKEENLICRLLNETIEENSKNSSNIIQESSQANVIDLNEYFESKSTTKSVTTPKDIFEQFKKLDQLKIYEGCYVQSIKCFRLKIGSDKELDFPFNLFFFKNITDDSKQIYYQFNKENDQFDFLKIFDFLSNDNEGKSKKIETLFIVFESKNNFYFIFCYAYKELKKVIDVITEQNYQLLKYI